jgi:pectate lyase-like protein
MAGSGSNFGLAFSQATVRAGGAHTNSSPQQPAAAGGGGSVGVTKIVAGTNVTVSPVGGTGAVTVNAASSGGTVTSVAAGTGLTASPSPIVGAGTLSITPVIPAAGPIGDSTHVAEVTVNAEGQVTALAPVAIAFPPQTPVVSVDSIALLRGITGMVDNQVAFVNSYAGGAGAQIGDGGGGFFTFVLSDVYSYDNGGTLIVPGGTPNVVNSQGQITTLGTLATVGAWHRCAWATQAGNVMQGTTMNVQHFGAKADGGTDCVPALRLAYAALSLNSQGVTHLPGTLYFPAGQYYFGSKWVVDMWTSSNVPQPVSIKGDGDGGTLWQYGMLTADTCMVEVRSGPAGGSIQDIGLQSLGVNSILHNPSVLWVYGTTSFSLVNVKGNGMIASQAINGGVFKLGSSTRGAWVSGTSYAIGDIVTATGSYFTCWMATSGTTTPGSDPAHWSSVNNPGNNYLTVIGCQSLGGGGVQLLCQSAGSPLMNSCSFGTKPRGAGAAAWISGHAYTVGTYVSDSYLSYFCRLGVTSTTHPASDPSHWEVCVLRTPCAVVSGVNTSKCSNTFFQGGGPWAQFDGSTISASGSVITVTTLTPHTFIAGGWVLIQGATNAGYNGTWKVAAAPAPTSTTISITSSVSLGADTASLSSLWYCWFANSITESDMDYCFFNTDGNPGTGSVGIGLDSWGGSLGGGAIGEFCVTNCICDYGNTAFFAQGRTNSDPASSCHQITLVNVRPNGGPRDTFGCYRLEGVTTIVADSCRAFPGGTGECDTWVISDGGQAFNTQDILITGGSATNKNSTGIWPGSTFVAFTFDGVNVHNVSIVNCGVDTAQTVAQLVNRSGTGTASLANGLTVLYGNNAGRLNLIDSSRGIGGGSL